MAILRAQVALMHSGALPEDIATNTFHFVTEDGVPDTEPPLIATALSSFYTGGHGPGGINIASFFSTEMAQNGHQIAIYNLADATPRVPVYETTFNLTSAPNGDPLPGEVALCLSFQGAAQSGESQARRRGRVYIGRFDKDSASSGRPSSSLQQTLAGAGAFLLSESVSAASWSWCVYSPTAAAAADPTPFAVVTNGWCDNAFDTQRRRGLAPTARVLFS